ncbi:C2H2-like zinc finger protein [Perilla frutescens var. hirtella]|uniref:C2H2-like zinc finger protein n=1 Tax=Perilla frutescens var. hirtella TaxID=608512 RepID=A0AAD4JA89_PERFH|nr:C2H2-like zinc finger protein [Perilla frutescens var. hirtella]
MLTDIDHSVPPEPFYSDNGTTSKRKRRPAGTPDPDAEVVSLSPKTLLESDRYVCEICNQGFQRDQNLQMHRRRHKVPWKLLKRETAVARKRVFVCPEPSCLHHDPCHALGDLVGIKKHFRRKHSNQKQWVCEKCSKGYAVQSDYKAHLKTCGTRGHSCDCGRVFSRVESFIEHQDACTLGRLRSEPHPLHPPAVCLSRTASSPSPSSDTNLSVAPWQAAAAGLALPKPMEPIFLTNVVDHGSSRPPNLELQLLTKASSSCGGGGGGDVVSGASTKLDEDHSTQLQLSIGSSEINGGDQKIEADNINGGVMTISRCSPRGSSTAGEKPVAAAAARVKEQAQEQLRIAVAEKAYAEEARQLAKRQIELAEQEFANAKRIRQQSQAELEKAQALKDHATKKINSAMLEITCHSCKHRFQQAAAAAAAATTTTTALFAESSSSRENSNSNSIGLNFISAALREWEVKKGDQK